MTSFVFHAADEAETRRFAAALAAVIRPGLVIGLNGPLGAGKTTFVRSLSESLGVDPRIVSSPTFVLVHHYQGRLPIYHFDAYRIGSLEEFLELGVDEYFASDGISVVEWADRVDGCLPDDQLSIRIEIASPNARDFNIRSSGAVSAEIVQDLAKELARAGKNGG